ncbi:hypothetical protein GCM10027275_25200 [Rhabdobacter roseus]|uniref:Uncharacterized protein n=1 Tax=Rhabdobacter roseus TaxID=1655419 RepID=A0A840TLL5_9BACT|nr:hypothetical protein [Rhabdobacter roseus]MBB5284461.1 hypothetical protein [Rhabdobacter roseus]
MSNQAISSRLEFAYRNRLWEILPPDGPELKCLISICEAKGNPKAALSAIFKGEDFKTPLGRELWNYLNQLDARGLIQIRRGEKQQVKYFDYHPLVAQKLQALYPHLFTKPVFPPVTELAVLEHSVGELLFQKPAEKLIAAGLFRPDHPVFLLASEGYHFKLVALPDGSQVLKIAPLDTPLD